MSGHNHNASSWDIAGVLITTKRLYGALIDQGFAAWGPEVLRFGCACRGRAWTSVPLPDLIMASGWRRTESTMGLGAYFFLYR